MLALLTTHFNPCGYARPRENFVRFVEGLGDLRKHLHVAELTYAGHRPLPIPGGYNHWRLQRGLDPAYLLWQKEALLNLLLRDLSPQYDAVAWIDADILFRDAEWYAQAERQLERDHAVQLFSRCRHYGPDGATVIDVRQNILLGRGHGYAWAARREFLVTTGGLLDWHVTGGADTFMGEAWLDRATDRRCSRAMWQTYVEWMAPLPASRSIGFLPGEIFHLWHGDASRRRPPGWSRFLLAHNFDPRRDVDRDPGGLLRWTGANPALEAAVSEYFTRRREDG